jgi:threonine/homoserine/homoserine lactone efflux protein
MLILSGIFVTAFNPTFPTWWLSIGVGLLSRALLFGLIGVITLTLGHWLADLTWFAVLGFAAVRGKLWLGEKNIR